MGERSPSRLSLAPPQSHVMPWALCFFDTPQNHKHVRDNLGPLLSAKAIAFKALVVSPSTAPSLFSTWRFNEWAGALVCGTDLDSSQMLQSLLASPDPAARSFPVALLPSHVPSAQAHVLAINLAHGQADCTEAILDAVLRRTTVQTDVIAVDVAGGRRYALVGVGLGLFRAPSGKGAPGSFVPLPLLATETLENKKVTPFDVMPILTTSDTDDGRPVALHGLLATTHSRIGALRVLEDSNSVEVGVMAQVLVLEKTCVASLATPAVDVDLVPLASVGSVRQFRFTLPDGPKNGSVNIDGEAVALPPGSKRAVSLEMVKDAILFVVPTIPLDSRRTPSRTHLMVPQSPSAALEERTFFPTLAPIHDDENDDDNSDESAAAVASHHAEVFREYTEDCAVKADCTATRVLDLTLQPGWAATVSEETLLAAIKDAINRALASAQHSQSFSHSFSHSHSLPLPASLAAAAAAAAAASTSVFHAPTSAFGPDPATPLPAFSFSSQMTPAGSPSVSGHLQRSVNDDLSSVGSVPPTPPPTPLTKPGVSRRKVVKHRSNNKSLEIDPKLLKEDRLYLIIYNPVSGSGKAKKIVDKYIMPVLRDFKIAILETQRRGHATDYIASIPDISIYTGIVVCGGDGMVSETVTGIKRRASGFDQQREEVPPVAIIPVGTANAMAHELNGEACDTFEKIVMSTLYAMLGGQTRMVDVISVKGARDNKYALSCVGWGLAGAVGLQADKLRWLPGQRSARYDIAGFITMFKDWPLSCRADFSYIDATTKQVVELKSIGVVNLIASSLPRLGVDHPICLGLKPDDGRIAVCLLDDTHSRYSTIQTALAMKSGTYLADRPEMRTFVASSFTLRPVLGSMGADVPFNIDGDPFDSQDISVTMLNRQLRVFAPNLDRGAPVQGPVALINPFVSLLPSECTSFPMRVYTDTDLVDLQAGGTLTTASELLTTRDVSWVQCWRNATPWTSPALVACLAEASKPESVAAMAAAGLGAPPVGPTDKPVKRIQVWCSGEGKAVVDYVIAPMLRLAGASFVVVLVANEDARLVLATQAPDAAQDIGALVFCGSKTFIHQAMESIVFGAREGFPAMVAARLAALPFTCVPVTFEGNMYVPNGDEKYDENAPSFKDDLLRHAGECVASLWRNQRYPLSMIELPDVPRPFVALSYVGWNVPLIYSRHPFADIDLTLSVDCRITITTTKDVRPLVMNVAMLCFFATPLPRFNGFRLHPDKCPLDGTMVLVVANARGAKHVHGLARRAMVDHYLSDFTNPTFGVVPYVTEFKIEFLGPAPARSKMMLDGMEVPLTGFTARTHAMQLQYTSKHAMTATPLVTPSTLPELAAGGTQAGAGAVQTTGDVPLRARQVRSTAPSSMLPVAQLHSYCSPLSTAILPSTTASPFSSSTAAAATREVLDAAGDQTSPNKSLDSAVDDGLPLPVHGRSFSSFVLNNSYRDWITRYSKAIKRADAAKKKFAVIANAAGRDISPATIVSRLVQPLLSEAGLTVTPIIVGNSAHQLLTIDPAVLDGIIVCGDDAFVSKVYTLLYTFNPAIANIVLAVVPLGTINAIASIAVPSQLNRNDMVAHCLYRALLGEFRPASILAARADGAEPAYGLAFAEHGLAAFLAAAAGEDGAAERLKGGALRVRLATTGMVGAQREGSTDESSTDSPNMGTQYEATITAALVIVSTLARIGPLALTKGSVVQSGAALLFWIDAGSPASTLASIARATREGRPLAVLPGVHSTLVSQCSLVVLGAPADDRPLFTLDDAALAVRSTLQLDVVPAAAKLFR